MNPPHTPPFPRPDAGSDPGMPDGDGPEEFPPTFPIQALPITTRVVRLAVPDGVATAIMRHWRPGDSGPSGRCRLCPRCKAYGDGCLIVVGFDVPRESAALFSSVGFPRQEKEGGREGC